jgi:hypothetical protein
MCSMQADSAFVIGRSHQDSARPCQDYALAGSAGEIVWAIVSDGCSSGGHTDIGARLWSHAAQQVLIGSSDLPRSRDTLHTALQQQAAPLLQPFAAEDAYATLGLACSNGRQARAALFGDGLVAVLMRNGELHSWELQYELNAPRYLAYARVDAHLAGWQAMVRGSDISLRIQRHDAAGTMLHDISHRYDAATYPGLWLGWDRIDTLQALLVCTDGAGSVPDQAAQDTLRQLLQIKNGTGQFMQRRLGAMARAWRKGQARPPVDDLAAAALWLGDNQ